MNARAILLPLIVVAGVLLATTEAMAQQCTDGRVANRATQGRCCWPGQRWSERFGRCDGAPSCPDGMDAFGDDCIAGAAPETGTAAATEPTSLDITETPETNSYTSATATATATATPDLTVTDVSGWPTSGGAPPEGALNPSRTTTADAGFIIVGLTAWLAGYGVGVAESVLFFTQQPTSTTWFLDYVAPEIILEGQNASDRSCGDTAGGLALIPFAGPLLAFASAESCRVPVYGPIWGRDGHVTYLVKTEHFSYDYPDDIALAFALTSTALQTFGAIFTLIGALSHRMSFDYEDPSRVDLGGGTTVAISPLAGANTVGLQLELTHL